MKKSLLAGLVTAALAAITVDAAHAFESFVVKDIRVEGIQRTEAGTVFSYLPVKVGETMTDEKASQSVKALFATGFFKDVRLEIENGVLVVYVEERPAIASIEFVGMKAFDKDALKKSLKEIGLSESQIFDRSQVERAEQELKRQYLTKGYYATTITTTITPLERNRVGLNFTVDEGDVAKIRSINLIGSKIFAEKDLLKEFVLHPPNWISWYTKNDQYSKQKLSADLETLRSYYQNRGYLEFDIASSQVSISEDKKDIYITVNVVEGEKYTVSSIKLAGSFNVPEAELKKLVTLKPGDVFSREKLTETTKAITNRLGNDGYAFANVNAVPEIDKEKHQAAFTIFIDPGRRVYVRRINVAGNTKTRDEVIRREMRQMEGAWYDGDKITKSRNRVDKLSYFDEVTVDTPPVAGTTDQVDMNINVKEKPTGALTLGAGFSSSEGIVLSSSLEQQNLFGSGKTVGVGLNTSKVNTLYSFSYTDPYYTIDGISRGFNVYHRKTDTSSLGIASYSTMSNGAGVNYGYPLTDDDYVNFGLNADNTVMSTDSNTPQRYIDYVNTYGNSNSSVAASLGWSHNDIDSRIYPTNGTLIKASGELSTPPGTLRYYKTTLQYQRYFPLSKDFVFHGNSEVGFANGYGGKWLPFYKNFYVGGIGSVRGYQSGTLGPKDASTGDALGGNKYFVANAEMLIPMPGMGQDKSVRLSTFFDMGQVWDKDDQVRFGDLRYSVGIGVNWTSPMGPLKFSIAQPIHKSADDKTQRLQFTMGTVF